MRISTNQAENKGSVLLVTLCSAWVIGIALVSYLSLVANQSRTTYHSQTWSACIPVLEAGIEEALTQLNYNNGEGTNNATAHGWTSANGVYFKSRAVGTDGSYFETTIDPNLAATPVITSKGYVPAPGNTGTPMGGNSAFGMILGTVGGQSPAMICRTVVVGTLVQNSRVRSGGIQSKGTISFTGGGVLDSFDSADPNYSTSGKYDATKRKANGVALTDSSTAGAISVGNSHIYGEVITGPGAGTVTINNGSVGDLAWNRGNTGIQTGHQMGDANVQFDDVTAPFVWGSGSTPIAGAVGGTNYTFVVNGASNTKWNTGTINIGVGKSLIVTGGDVSVYVNGNFSISGSGFVYVAPGASLKLYVAGTFSNSGGSIVNGDGLASKLGIYGLGTTKETWSYSGSSAFIGTVYSPYDAFNFSGTAGAFGSFTADNVLISGGASVHFDESLSGAQNPEYLVSSWNEI